jgi:hypothetical protein
MSVPFSPGIKFSQFVNGGVPVPGDLAAGLRNGVDTLFAISGAGPDSTLTLPITQAAHGLVVGNVVRLNGLLYVRAQANNAVNAEVVGIVIAVADANNFTLQFGGLVSALGFVAIPGTVYFLDAVTAGALTAVPPAVVGQIRKPILVANTAASGFWQNQLGQQI